MLLPHSLGWAGENPTLPKGNSGCPCGFRGIVPVKIHLLMGFAWVITEGGLAFPALRSSQLCASRDFTGALRTQGVAQIEAQCSLGSADLL